MSLVLIVEDELNIARIVRDYLEHEGFQVEHAADGEAGLSAVRRVNPDLIVLDLRLPKRDGLDVAREVRRFSEVPIVMVTARGEEADRVAGLELGADDYIVKPFSPRELVARIRAVLRRTDAHRGAPEIREVGDLRIDIDKMRTTAGARTVDLTPTEFQLLTALMRQPGRVFTRAQLLDALHGVAFESYERAIDAHIKKCARSSRSRLRSRATFSRCTASATVSTMRPRRRLAQRAAALVAVRLILAGTSRTLAQRGSALYVAHRRPTRRSSRHARDIHGRLGPVLATAVGRTRVGMAAGTVRRSSP